MTIPSPKMDQIIGSFDSITGAIDSAAILDLLDFTNLTTDQLNAAGNLDSLDNLGNLDSLSTIKVRVVGATTTHPTTASIAAEIQPATLAVPNNSATEATTVFGMVEEKTYTVTVASGTNNYGTGNKYFLDGSVSPTITLVRGGYYVFDQSDSSNSTHPLRFSTTANGTHAGGTEYTSGVTTSSNQVVFRVPSNAPDTLYYYCANHSGMGGVANLTNGASRERPMAATSVSAGSVQADADALRPLDGNMTTSATIAAVNAFTNRDLNAQITTSASLNNVVQNFVFAVDSTDVSGFDAPFVTVQAICTAIFTDSGSMATSVTANTPTPEKLGEEWTVIAQGNEVWRAL